jgi:tetratricopeptide (TPR) repeat protein
MRNADNKRMNPQIFEKMKQFYEELDKHLLSVEGNVCKACQCNECCTFAAKGGKHSVSDLEFDYIEHYYQKTGYPQANVSLFKEYLSKKKDNNGNVIHAVCPFFNHEEHACSIYPARPISCRVYGSYFLEGMPVPSKCYFKNIGKTIKTGNFFKEFPMALEFCELKSQHMGSLPMRTSKKETTSLILWDLANLDNDDAANDPFILGCKLEREGKFGKAAESFEQAMKLYPSWSFIPCCLGTNLVRLKRLEEAIKAYKQALSLSPDNAFYHFVLAFALKLNGQYDEAQLEYEKAVELNPQNVIALASLANLHQKKGNLQASMNLFQKALKLDPDSAFLRFHFAQLLLKLNEIKEAESQLEKAIELEPDFPPPYLQAAHVYSIQNKTLQAQEVMKKYEELSRKQLAASLTFGFHLEKS